MKGIERKHPLDLHPCPYSALPTRLGAGIIRTDPFSEYSLEMQETDRGYLTEEELKLIANTVFVDKQTNLVRDMFLFGCFTFVALINTAL